MNMKLDGVCVCVCVCLCVHARVPVYANVYVCMCEHSAECDMHTALAVVDALGGDVYVLGDAVAPVDTRARVCEVVVDEHVVQQRRVLLPLVPEYVAVVCLFC